MVKTPRLWVIGVLFFLILTGVEAVHYYLFTQISSRDFFACLDTAPELSQLCMDLVKSSDNAYYQATNNHILSYFALFGLFLILTTRLSSLEEKVSKLERSGDV